MPSRTPPPPPASPRHASSRRAAGCGNEPSRAHTYALIFAGQERRIRNGQGTIRDIGSWLLPTRTWAWPTSLHPAAFISTRSPTLAVTKSDHICLTRSFLELLLPPATPSRLPRTRSTGEQASETSPLRFLYGRGAIRFLGSDHATARLRPSASSTSASPSSSPCLHQAKLIVSARKPRRRRQRILQIGRAHV